MLSPRIGFYNPFAIMGKASSMAIVCALVLPLLLLRFTSLVAAVDVLFFKSPDFCTYGAFSCVDLPPDTCCVPPIVKMGAVGTSAEWNVVSSLFRGEECTDFAFEYRGTVCVHRGTYAGVSYVFRGLPKDSETYKVSNTCKAQIKPTSLVYLDDSTKGRWVLTTNNATELFLQMENVPDVEVVDWLESHGATFKSSGL